MPKPFNPQDRFFKKAKEQNLRARSVFKLEEIQNHYGVLNFGNKILDLGAAPGSWTQYAAKKVGESGRVVAVDLQVIAPFSAFRNVDYIVGNVFSGECEKMLRDKYVLFDVILSDMAPKTSGIKGNDQWASVELGIRVLDLCKFLLKKNGILLIKIFQGEDFNLFWKKCRLMFKKARIIRPEAVRSSSREVYVLANDFSGQ